MENQKLKLNLNHFYKRYMNKSNISQDKPMKEENKQVATITKEKDSENEIKQLKTIFSAKHQVQFLNEMVIKMRLPEVIYDYSNSDDEFFWKCSAKVIKTEISGEGYNNSKKEAKKIAAEQIILSFLKNQEHSQEVKKIIQDEYVKNVNGDSDETHLSKKRGRDEEVKTNEQKENQSMNLNLEAADGFSQLLLEIFVLKFERLLILGREETCLNDFHSALKANLNMFDEGSVLIDVGSTVSNTMRANHIETDIIFVNKEENTNVDDKLLTYLKGNYGENYEISLLQCNWGLYNAEEKFLKVKNTTTEFSASIYFYQDRNKFLHAIKQHKKWLKGKVFSTEKIIACKFLKAWRRSRSLMSLKTEIIESLVYMQKGDNPTDYLIEFLVNLAKGSLLIKKGFRPLYAEEFHLVFLQNITFGEINLIQDEAKLALKKIGQMKFELIF